jgi:hypothetical protein
VSGQHAQSEHATAEDTASAVLAIAAPNPKSFDSAIAGRPDLFAAVVHHSRLDDLWLPRLTGRLKQRGVTSRDCLRLESTVKQRIKAEDREARGARTNLRTIDPDAPPPLVRDALGDDAPVHEEAVVPPGFRLSRSGIVMAKAAGRGEVQEVQIASDPVVISGRLVDAGSGDELVQVSWVRDARWKSETVRRSVVANRSEIVKLADKGFPVDSGTAPDVVSYCSHYEATNRLTIPVGAVSAHLGWQGPQGEHGFLCGRRLITGDGVDTGETDPAAIFSQRDRRILDVSFHGSGEGDDELADGLRAAGTLDGWKRAASVIEPYPRARLMLYAAFAAPLLDILGLDTYFVDLSGMTSTGKTTSLRLAASVWGQPDPAQPGSMLGSWNSSPTYIERRAALFNGIPVLLDDSKQARDPEFVARMIYDLASGQGKGRGTIGGLRRSERWRTVVLTTGEQRLADFTQDGGTRGRVIPLWGAPFGPATSETSYLVSRLPTALETDHGHAGPAFVAYLLQHREEWDSWRSQWREEVDAYAQENDSNPIVGRLGGFLASIFLAAVIAHDAGLIPWELANPIDPIWDDIVHQGQEADRALAAMQDVAGWAAANQQSFLGRHVTDGNGHPKMPAGGWYGKWDDEEKWERVAFAPARLDEFLKGRGYDKSVVALWRDRGWLETDSEAQRLTKKVRFGLDDLRGSGDGRCYVIKREALAQ